MSKRFSQARAIGLGILVAIPSVLILQTMDNVHSQQIKPADQPFTPPQNTAGPFKAPQYLLEVLERSTTQGPEKLKGYRFYERTPGPGGVLVMPDGSGGTYNLKCRQVAGPLANAQAVCQAIKQLPPEDRKGLVRGQGYNWADVWDCSEEQPAETLIAWLEGDPPPAGAGPGSVSGTLPGGPAATSSPITLDPGRLPSVSRGIYVKGWKRNTIDRVELCFPGQTDLWATNDNNIVIFPGNSSEDPANMSGYPKETYYFPLLWRARCQSKPGKFMITVHVQQRRFPGESAAMPPEHGQCVDTPGRVTLQIPVVVTTAISPNCTLPPAGTPGGPPAPPTFFPPPPPPPTPPGQPPPPPQPPGPGPKKGKWKTNFGDIEFVDEGNGKVSGTLGDGGTIKGTIKDNELIGDFVDKSGDGKISITLNPDGKGFTGDWVRTRGPGAGKTGPLNGGQEQPPGTNNPGGPGTSPFPPLTPVPAPVQKMTLQVPEFRIAQGQRLMVPIWLINGKDVANIDWNLHFDPLIIRPQDVDSPSVTRQGNLLANERFESNVRLSGVAYFAFGRREGGIAGTGTVGIANFQAVGPPGSKTPLTLEVSVIKNPNQQVLPIDLIHGFVEIIKPIDQVPGSNGGGGGSGGGGAGGGGGGGGGGGPEVTFKDAQDALKMAVKLIPENINLDLDRDGRVTSSDAVLIMRRAYLYFGKEQP